MKECIYLGSRITKGNHVWMLLSSGSELVYAGLLCGRTIPAIGTKVHTMERRYEDKVFIDVIW